MKSIDRTEIAKPPTPDELALDELGKLSVEELREELSRALTLTVSTLRRMALIVRVLEDRGEDLSDIKIGLLLHLRQIAHGQLLPELVVRFASSPRIMRTVSLLPLPDQRSLASGNPVELVSRGERGLEKRLVDPLNMSAEQLRQVFGPQGIRDESEQAAILNLDRPSTLAPTLGKRKVGRISIDAKRGGLIMGHTFFSVGDVIESLALLRAPSPDGAQNTESVSCLITPSERIALDIAASRAGVSRSIVMRRALAACGLFSES